MIKFEIISIQFLLFADFENPGNQVSASAADQDQLTNTNRLIEKDTDCRTQVVA